MIYNNNNYNNWNLYSAFFKPNMIKCALQFDKVIKKINEIYKTDYRNLQTDYRKNKVYVEDLSCYSFPLDFTSCLHHSAKILCSPQLFNITDLRFNNYD